MHNEMYFNLISRKVYTPEGVLGGIKRGPQTCLATACPLSVGPKPKQILNELRNLQRYCFSKLVHSLGRHGPPKISREPITVDP